MAESCVAFIGFGEINSPRELIERKCSRAHAAISSLGVDSHFIGPVADDPDGHQVDCALKRLAELRPDAIILCIAGWVPSHAVMNVIADYRHVPLVLWGLTGEIVQGRLVTTADQAGTSALRRPMADMGYTFKYVYEVCGAASRASVVTDYVRAALAAAALRHSRIGMMGFRDMKLFATLHDGVSLRRRVGTDIEVFEMLEMVQNAARIRTEDVDETIAYVKSRWTFLSPADDEFIRRGAGYYLALRDMLVRRRCDGVSLTDVDGMKRLLNFPPSMILMLLADRLGLCTTPENDGLGTVTQLMVRYLTGQIGAYLEFYEFMDDRVLMGVPDYVPAEIVDGPVLVLPTSFGGFGQCLLNVSRIKTGKVTLCRLSNCGTEYTLHIVTGTAVTPRTWEEAGWAPPAPQLPSLEVVLDTPVEEFAQKVLGQHYIISYGDNRRLLGDLCAILGVTLV